MENKVKEGRRGGHPPEREELSVSILLLLIDSDLLVLSYQRICDLTETALKLRREGC